jgi:hypothetical protein
MQLAVRIVGLAARLLLALGLVCLLLGGWLAWQTTSFASTAISTTGRVVSYNETVEDGKPMYRPRVRYETHRGEINTVVGQMAYTSQRIPVGGTVPVMYQENDTMKMRVATFFDSWLGACVAAAIGVICFIGGIFVRRSLRRAPLA